MLNRIHPETGLVLDDRLDYKRSQEWALEYEKEMGRIWCEKRLDYEKPREERAPAANDNLPHNVIELARPLEPTTPRRRKPASKCSHLSAIS